MITGLLVEINGPALQQHLRARADHYCEQYLAHKDDTPDPTRLHAYQRYIQFHTMATHLYGTEAFMLSWAEIVDYELISLLIPEAVIDEQPVRQSPLPQPQPARAGARPADKSRTKPQPAARA